MRTLGNFPAKWACFVLAIVLWPFNGDFIVLKYGLKKRGRGGRGMCSVHQMMFAKEDVLLLNYVLMINSGDL